MVTQGLSATPLHRSRWRHARWLVIAPHADDETIGCGSLIAETEASRCLAAVVFLTDGAGSHPTSSQTEKSRLTATRRQEARQAMRMLAPRAPAPIFLDWPDATPYAPGGGRFAAAVRKLAALCDQKRVDAIAVTARIEPHCDHVAAYQVAVATCEKAHRLIDVLQYVVWSPSSPVTARVVRTRAMPQGQRSRALAQHRSQITPLYGEGFRLPESMRQSRASDLWFFRWLTMAGTLRPDYFERMFANDPDPWRFETSPYEAAKYDQTISALGQRHYKHGLEVGCAIGVLTERLAQKCDKLSALDVSNTALAQAKRRCAEQHNIIFSRSQFPLHVPADRFDLIVMSEVVYYWDGSDLARAASYVATHLDSGGDLLLVHWTGETDYPQTGDEAVGKMQNYLPQLAIIMSLRNEKYRLDLWRKP